MRKVATVDVTSPAPPNATPIKLHSWCNGGREIYIDVRPDETSTNIGRPDTDGLELHIEWHPATGNRDEELRYRGPNQGAEPGSGGPFLRAMARGRHAFRQGGTIYLVGGVGDWRVTVWEGRLRLEPHWHDLPVLLRTGATFEAPSFASHVGAMSEPTSVTDAAGIAITLGHVRVPMSGAMARGLSQTSGRDVWLFVSWYG